MELSGSLRKELNFTLSELDFTAGHQQQTIQIPPILTQLDLLQKQLLLQQQAQQQLGVGPNGMNVGASIPQVHFPDTRII